MSQGHNSGKDKAAIRGKVTGRVWSTKHVDSLSSGALLEIQTDKGDSIIAFDPLGCAEGEEVLIIQGSVAAGFLLQVEHRLMLS